MFSFIQGDKSSGEKFAAHLFAGILEPHKASNGLEEPNYAEVRRNNGYRAGVDDPLSDTSYTSYWNKYNPKNGNGMQPPGLLYPSNCFMRNAMFFLDHKQSDVDSVDSGPTMAAPWYMSNANSRLNRSASVR